MISSLEIKENIMTCSRIWTWATTLYYGEQKEEKPIDLLKATDPPNEDEYRNAILYEINQFQKKWQALLCTEKAVAVPAGLTFLAWVGGYISLGTSIALYLAACYAFQKSSHGDQYDAFTKQLNRMIQIYHQSCTRGPAITKNAAFLQLLETLIPFVIDGRRIFLPWDLSHADPTNISPDFINLVSQPPLNIQFVMVNGSSIGERFETPAASTRWGRSKHLVWQSAAELKQIIYGVEVKGETKEYFDHRFKKKAC